MQHRLVASETIDGRIHPAVVAAVDYSVTLVGIVLLALASGRSQGETSPA
jgi:hypothetical protein